MTLTESAPIVAESKEWSIYVAEEFIQGWEDPFFMEVEEFNKALVLNVDGGSRIEQVVDYKEWIAPWRQRWASARPPQDTPIDSRLGYYSPHSLYRDPISNRLMTIATNPAVRQLAVADPVNRRILLLNERGQYIKELGGIGQRLGDLASVQGVAMDRSGKIYVLDSMSVQIFSEDGSALKRFQIGTASDSIAVNDAGEVSANTPRTGTLVTVYDSQGRSKRRFGQLPPLSALYPGKKDDASMLSPMGRAFLLAGEENSIYVCFQFAPVLQKYDAGGRLVWQVRLNGAVVDEMTKTFWHEPGAPRGRGSKNMDGIQLAKITSGVCRTNDGTIAVLLANNAIVLVRQDGRQVGVLHSRPSSGGTCDGFGFHGGSYYFTSGAKVWKSIAVTEQVKVVAETDTRLSQQVGLQPAKKGGEKR